MADNIAGTALPKKEFTQAGSFNLLEYSRIRDYDEVNVYIEGDGLSWIAPNEQSQNPTPINPVALRLAAQDNSWNVLYLARPCQYVQEKCASEFWGHKRYAPEVIEAYMQALDRMNFKKLNLIGYSGGGAIASILAAKRTDVVSLRTVAGNIDTAAFTNLHEVSAMVGSVNPADMVKNLVHMPQIHFVGAKDEVVPASIFYSYAKKIGKSDCLQMRLIPEVTHEGGWTDKWPLLLESKPFCKEGMLN